MNSEHIFWTFSAAAQSIAAFVALLLAGYALVHAFMESARERDDSLDEIHSALRATYHRMLARVACLSGFAILLSLATVYVNRWSFETKTFLVGFAALTDVAAIVAGLAFVVYVVDPKRYERVAEKELEKEEPSADAAPATEFFDAFRHLERLVRDYLRQRDLYVPSKGAPRMSYSFRQMIEALFQNEIIDRSFFEDLMEVNKYRNLVFHGHVDSASREMVSRAKDAAERMGSLE